MELEQIHRLCEANTAQFPSFNEPDLVLMKKKYEKMLKRINSEIVEMSKQHKTRICAFNGRFRAFADVFDSLAKDCYTKWNLALELFYNDSPLEHPIRFIVDDQTIDPAYVCGALLNHHLAALILKLAMNKFLRSPVIIFDRIDYVIDPHLIRYLQQLCEYLVKNAFITIAYFL